MILLLLADKILSADQGEILTFFAVYFLHCSELDERIVNIVLSLL